MHRRFASAYSKRETGRGPGRRLPSALDLFWADSRPRWRIAGIRNHRRNRSQHRTLRQPLNRNTRRDWCEAPRACGTATRWVRARSAAGWRAASRCICWKDLAEFKLNWAVSGRATVSLEGPAAMMLTSEGMPTLRFGRLTATISTAHRPFVLETPVGRLVLAEYGSIGVSAFGNEGEIHVFDGTAILEPAWRTTDEEAMPLKIEAGQAIRVQPGRRRSAEHYAPLGRCRLFRGPSFDGVRWIGDYTCLRESR